MIHEQRQIEHDGEERIGFQVLVLTIGGSSVDPIVRGPECILSLKYGVKTGIPMRPLHQEV